MQTIRAIKAEDFDQLKTIYKTYFEDEFAFPDFVRNYIAAFVVEDNEKIIVAGGVRMIPEAVMLTNKDIPTTERREAMASMLTAMAYVSRLDGHEHLHAFVRDDKWKRHLIRAGFIRATGDALVLKLE